MTPQVPKTSSRLRRAAIAERGDLLRARGRLEAERRQLASTLQRVDESLAEIDDRLRTLERLAPGVEQQDSAPHSDADEDAALTRLRGPAIREAAVRVLLSHEGDRNALHYREWYSLVREAGYEVAGKDPIAVFLTQLSRSPVIRKTTQAGVYELDQQSVTRIQGRLERLQAELREATRTPDAPADLAEIRARRHDLNLAVTQEERALEEALRLLGQGSRSDHATTAAG